MLSLVSLGIIVTKICAFIQTQKKYIDAKQYLLRKFRFLAVHWHFACFLTATHTDIFHVLIIVCVLPVSALITTHKVPSCPESHVIVIVINNVRTYSNKFSSTMGLSRGGATSQEERGTCLMWAYVKHFDTCARLSRRRLRRSSTI